MHGIRKLANTLRILACLGMARTFGQYEHSVWSGDFHYAQYRWRGQSWAIPTSALEPTDA